MLQKISFNVYDDTEIFFNEYSSNDSFLLSYRQLGFIRTKSAYKNIKEGFSEWFFLFLIDGSMSLTYEGKTYLLEPNSVFLIDSKKRFELSENSDGSSMYFVYVKGGHMDLIYNVFAQSYKSPIIKDAQNLKESFASLYQKVKEMNYSNLNEEDAKIVINGYLYEFISKVMYEVEKRKFEVSSIDNVVNYIYENYQKEITVDLLAKMSGYSKFHFIKLFKAKYNETPARFINIYRAKRALNVIVAENKTVEQSAYDSGFKDKRALIRICKNTFGTLPSKLTKRGFDQKINSKKLGNTIFTNIKNIGDPFILYENKSYYMFGTSLTGESLSCYIGNNLTKFNEKPVVVLNKKDSFGNSDFWAPEIIKYNGQYYMFYSSRGDDKDLHVSVAKSNNIIGPYIDINKEKPLLPWVTIDASPFIDVDGKAYLLFVMDCSKNIVDGKHTSEINIIRLDKSLSKTIGKPKKLLTPDSKWEYKKNDEFRWNEGPSMIYHDGYYYITYSAHSYLDPDYSVGVARSKKVTGPFVKSKDSPILKRIEKITSGTGHNSFFIDKNGQLMTAYHIHTDIDNPAFGRRACISPVKFINNSLIIDYK